MSQYENFELQLAEVEMLTSMYPNHGEFSLHDPGAVVQIRDFLSGNLEYEDVGARIGFTLKVVLESNNHNIDIVCNLPHDYPLIKPLIFLNSQTFSRKQHQILRDDMTEYLSSLNEGELCIANVIDWFKENSFHYLEKTCSIIKTTESEKNGEKFTRLWIYSHHIYSKLKRKSMLDMAPLLQLTGFFMPGKPGMIYVEGKSSHVEEFWSTIRNWNWKRLMIKEKEEIIIDITEIEKSRKFEHFSEKCFDPRAGRSREVHMDFGLLFTFLEDNGFKHIFYLYFGVEGHAHTSD